MSDAPMFGTTGIRNVFSSFKSNDDEHFFTPEIALKLGLSIGTLFNGGSIVIGRDIRMTALPVEYALISGLISTGCKVKRIGMVTTPTLAMSIDALNADCGIMITASHNPPEYIGIKLWNKRGLGFSSKQESEIEAICKNKSFLKKKWNEIGVVDNFSRINQIHIEKVLEFVNTEDMGRKFEIIIDPGNGSSCEIVPLLMNHLKFKYITLNSQPDGTFPGRLSEPSSAHLEDLTGFVSFSKNTELGIALDGDADRVVFVDGYGKVIEPIRILAFLGREVIKENNQEILMGGGKNLKIATPINSSRVIEHVMNPLGVEVIRTAIGDIKVSQALKKQGGFLGGETAGTFMWPHFHYGPDVLITIAMMLKFLSKYKRQFKDIMAEIPDFPFLKNSIKLKKQVEIKKPELQELAAILEEKLEKNNFNNISETYLDGLHLEFDGGWLLIRPSGTTPLIRTNAESTVDLSEAKKIEKICFESLEIFMERKGIKKA